MPSTLDKTLAELQDDAGQSLDTIAAKVGSSKTPVWNRIRKLKEAGVIRKEVASAQLVRADNKQPLGQITISTGVATYQGESDLMDFIDRADRALYQSKNNGRNRTSVA